MPNDNHDYRLQRRRRIICAAALSSALLHLAMATAVLSENSSTSGKHWSNLEIEHLLDRLIELRINGVQGDGNNFPATSFTAASSYLAGKGFTRTAKQCSSKYATVRIPFDR